MNSRIRLLVISLVCGLLFGCGLIIARMHDPAKVLNFLDLTGNWDPSLAFVMLGAIGVAAVPFHWLTRRGHGASGHPLHFPSAGKINTSLLIGSVLFGAGWGLAGICPGPAIVDLALGWQPALLFVVGMVGGFLLFGMFRASEIRT
ncbi:MAG: hypothetical protein P4L87_16905 [Formivibrio sp.]|nr:hypothetical protein [Formivibrio sp.]